MDNINKETEEPGYYRLYDQDRKEIYIGSSNRIQHRLFALFYGRSDYATVKTKKALRKKAKFYYVQYTDINNARRTDREEKDKKKFNVL